MLPRRKMIVIFFVISIGLFALSYYPAQTAVNATLTFTVNSNVDLPDFATNGVCSVGHETNGLCTLRAAITEARGNAPSQPVTVRIPPGTYTLTIPPDPENEYDYRHGDLDITPIYPPSSPANPEHWITIEPTVAGGEVIIRTASNFNDRILEIGNANVNIRNIKFIGAHFVLTGVENGGFPKGGGAIYNSGTLTLEGTTFESNSVACVQGSYCPSGINGGAIFNEGSLSIIDTTFQNNSADQGFAIFNEIEADSCRISHSLFFENHGEDSGTITNRSTMSITNSTMSGNHTAHGYYAGIVNQTKDSSLSLRSCTFANSGNYSSIHNYGFVFISDSIFRASPEKLNFQNVQQGSGTTGGYNIFNDSSWFGTYSLTDKKDTDPKLGFLRNNGGPTWTHSLLIDSPAINNRPTHCSMILLPIFVDQRHQPRNDSRCDTGAFELGHNYLPLITR